MSTWASEFLATMGVMFENNRETHTYIGTIAKFLATRNALGTYSTYSALKHALWKVRESNLELK